VTLVDRDGCIVQIAMRIEDDAADHAVILSRRHRGKDPDPRGRVGAFQRVVNHVFDPVPDAADLVEQAAPERRELIVDARRNHRMHVTRCKAVALKLAQCLREHLLAHAAYLLSQPRKAHLAARAGCSGWSTHPLELCAVVVATSAGAAAA